MSVAPVCPRCGEQLVVRRGSADHAWCHLHGAVTPLHHTVLVAHDAIVAVTADARVPAWVPDPMPSGWSVTGLAWGGEPGAGALVGRREGTRAARAAVGRAHHRRPGRLRGGGLRRLALAGDVADERRVAARRAARTHRPPRPHLPRSAARPAQRAPPPRQLTEATGPPRAVRQDRPVHDRRAAAGAPGTCVTHGTKSSAAPGWTPYSQALQRPAPCPHEHTRGGDGEPQEGRRLVGRRLRRLLRHPGAGSLRAAGPQRRPRPRRRGVLPRGVRRLPGLGRCRARAEERIPTSTSAGCPRGPARTSRSTCSPTSG